MSILTANITLTAPITDSPQVTTEFGSARQAINLVCYESKLSKELNLNIQCIVINSSDGTNNQGAYIPQLLDKWALTRDLAGYRTYFSCFTVCYTRPCPGYIKDI